MFINWLEKRTFAENGSCTILEVKILKVAESVVWYLQIMQHFWHIRNLTSNIYWIVLKLVVIMLEYK